MSTFNFWVLAGPAAPGWGHYMRCLALACELRERGHTVGFCGNEPAVESAKGKGFEETHVLSQPADVWLADLRNLDMAGVYRMKQSARVVVNLNGGDCDDEVRNACRLVFYLGCSPQPYKLRWDTSGDVEWFEGAEWVMLRSEFWENRRFRTRCKPRRIVVCGGGSDIGGLTDKAVKQLKDDYEVRAIIGQTSELAKSRWAPVGIEVLTSPPSMAEAMAWADLAVVSYGTVAYEALCLGIPTVAFSIDRNHEADADLIEARSGRSLLSAGYIQTSGRGLVREAVEAQGNLMAVHDLSAKALRFLDGRGAQRVAEWVEGVL